MTSYIYHSQLDGALTIETENSDGERKRFNYAFMRDRDYSQGVTHWAIYRVGVDARLNTTHWSVVGTPTENNPYVELWADGTDMPVDMARAFVSCLYNYYPFVLDSTEYGEDGGVVSFKFEALIPPARKSN